MQDIEEVQEIFTEENMDLENLRTCLRSFSEVQIPVQKPHKAGLVTQHSFEIPN